MVFCVVASAPGFWHSALLFSAGMQFCGARGMYKHVLFLFEAWLAVARLDRWFNQQEQPSILRGQHDAVGKFKIQEISV